MIIKIIIENMMVVGKVNLFQSSLTSKNPELRRLASLIQASAEVKSQKRKKARNG